jgi:hypothetical protein
MTVRQASRDRQTCVAAISVSAERTVDAPADTVYRYVADMREHHPRLLPRRSQTSGWSPVAWEPARSPASRCGRDGGLFERLFAPRVMRALYADELERLDACAREYRPA